jgi:hypothetical protein
MLLPGIKPGPGPPQGPILFTILQEPFLFYLFHFKKNTLRSGFEPESPAVFDENTIFPPRKAGMIDRTTPTELFMRGKIVSLYNFL